MQIVLRWNNLIKQWLLCYYLYKTSGRPDKTITLHAKTKKKTVKFP